MELSKMFINLYDKYFNIIDDSILSYIDLQVNDKMSRLEKAIIIYLSLGDILTYSTEFSLFHNLKTMSKIKDITLTNQEIVCKSWAILYAKLLRKYGINAKSCIEGTHYYVRLEIDNVIYVADATIYGGSKNYKMSDIAKIKYGFKIDNFSVRETVNGFDSGLLSEGYINLNNLINKVYMEQNRKYYTDLRIDTLKLKVLKLIIKNSKRVGVGTLDDLNYRVKLINRFWTLDIANYPLEKIQLFNSFFKDLFQDLIDCPDYKVKSYNLYSYLNGELFIYKLIAIMIDDKYFYYLDDGKEFRRYDYKELRQELRKRYIMIPDYIEILGLEDRLDFHKVKSY